MSTSYFLQDFAVTLGANAYSQDHMAEDMCAKIAVLPESKSLTQMISFIYSHSEIKNRFFELPLSEISSRSDWYRLINQVTLSISLRILKDLFSKNVSAEDCDGFIVASSSHYGFPSLSRHLQEQLGFPLTAICYDLTGLGCAGTPHAIFLAQTLLETGRCKKVCVLCVDAMGTYSYIRKYTKLPTMSQVVAHCLCSDGAAAMVLSKTPGVTPILSYQDCTLTTKLWPNSLELNVFSACEDNLPMMSVGKEIRERLVDELNTMLSGAMLLDPTYIHPGGVALMKIVGQKYPEFAESAALSIADLAEHGNVGSPSVLWVLKTALKKNMPLTPCFRLVTFGPGKVTAIVTLDKVELLNKVENVELVEEAQTAM